MVILGGNRINENTGNIRGIFEENDGKMIGKFWGNPEEILDQTAGIMLEKSWIYSGRIVANLWRNPE